jgi:hypothetical protein
MNNKQKYYFLHNSTSYLHYIDPGLFISRQFGRLYYEILFDNLKVEEFSYKSFTKLKRFNSPISRTLSSLFDVAFICRSNELNKILCNRYAV